MANETYCAFDDCGKETVATATDPLTGLQRRVCIRHAKQLHKLDKLAKQHYAAVGDPRAHRMSLVVWDPPTHGRS
jgi:hypothetical protein